ncbi:rhamnosyltransferase subunit B [Rhodopirellula rubra]|uniref:Rhamnosyltransferase subunit B n=1 Tax=Aporhodopirellula rubra TaxID=980271 RepID=A0A7W5E0E2_9BACT|nr:nucleotide disphospho-sugar-binding domain-containing protein [Aporhodopirellula rubra]MBB3207866.1 rhamnosyltransferase subunit B [Aporhodopirellula rubra]
MSDPRARRSRPRAILSAPGSRGDVNPMVAIGRELDAIGFECHVSVAEPYVDVVEKAGLHANVVIDSESFHRVVSQTQFWKPWTGARRVLTEVAEKFFHPHLQFIDQMFVPGETVLVAHPLDFASLVFQETQVAKATRVSQDASSDQAAASACRLSSVHLAPAMLRHSVTPPRLLPDRGWTRGVLPEGWNRLNRMTYFLADIMFLDRVIGGPVNAERKRRAGLAPQRRLMQQWWRSPDQVLGLYPAWFAPEIFEKYSVRSGTAAPLQCVGFPLDDGVGPVNNEVEAGGHGGGQDQSAGAESLPLDRPLLVTTGSAHHGDESLVIRIADLCESAGVGVVWCCPSNPGGVVHRNIRSVGYVPLGQWLPHCRGIVHHGGIGTTSRAIDAKVPQLIRPMAFDQFDNAARVERFGLGVSLRSDSGLASAIAALLAMGDDPLSVPEVLCRVDEPRGISDREASNRREPAVRRAARLIASLLS